LSAFKSSATTGLVLGIKYGDNGIYIVNNGILGLLRPAKPACTSVQLYAVKVKQVQGYWVFGLCPLSDILKITKEHNVLETGSVS
jgi:hypothetical protein